MEVAVSKAASTGLEGLGWACLHPRRKDGGSRQVEAPARFCAVEDGNFDSVFFVLCRFFFSLNVLARWPPVCRRQVHAAVRRPTTWALCSIT